MSGSAADAEEQRTGIEQVDAALGMMDSITQQNAALVEQASAAAQLLDEQSRDLTRQVAVFSGGRRGMTRVARARRTTPSAG